MNCSIPKPDPAEMNSDVFDTQLRRAIHVQRDLLQRIGHVFNDVEQSFESNDETANQIAELEKLMDEVEQNVGGLRARDLDDYDPQEVRDIYSRNYSSIQRDIEHLDVQNWDRFVRQTRSYVISHGVDPFAPYDVILTDADRQRLREESYGAQHRWEWSDYLFVGLAGVLASLVDYFLVVIPQDMNKTHLGVRSKYYGQQGSPITKWMQSYDTHKADDAVARFTNWLGELCKVPYDRGSAVINGELNERIAGMSPDTHRLQSLGHDPALALIAGFFDVLRGTMTGFSYDNASGVHTLFQGDVQAYLPSTGFQETAIRLIEALLKPLGHLVSDVGSKAGLPAPFMTLIQGINAGSIGPHNKTVGQLARYMYRNGYDFRHFLVSGTTPAVVEVILRAYVMLRHYSEHGDVKFQLASQPKYRSMLLSAHAIACAGNAGKIYLQAGNPLAINQSEWMALFRYLVPHAKYMIFDRHRLRIEHMEEIIDEEWDQVLSNGRDILHRIGDSEMSEMRLGMDD